MGYRHPELAPPPRASVFSPRRAFLTAGPVPSGLHGARCSQPPPHLPGQAEPAWTLGLPRKFKIAAFGPEGLHARERPYCLQLSQPLGGRRGVVPPLRHCRNESRPVTPTSHATPMPAFPSGELARTSSPREDGSASPRAGGPLGSLFTGKAPPCRRA